MRHFKKRTLALVLASVVTVVGAFGAENYKNSLMNLTFESSANGINMNVETKIPYGGNVSPIKKDATTYVLMLPEMDSSASTPDLSAVTGQIESVNIRTMPYSSNAKGYTRITIKTYNQSLYLTGQSKLYIETIKEETQPEIETNSTNIVQNNSYNNNRVKNTQNRYSSYKTKQNYRKNYQQNRTYRKQNIEPQQTINYNDIESNLKEEKINYNENSFSSTENTTFKKKKDSTSPFLLWLFSILIVLCSVYFYSKAKTKMAEITGENFDINGEENPKKRKQQRADKINTVNKIDKSYTKSYIEPIKNDIKIQKEEVQKDFNIVDLDELFKEQSTENIDENLALEDFLSGFSFMEEEQPLKEPEKSFDEEFYKKVITNPNIKFSTTEVNCIYKLISNEITDEIYQDIEKNKTLVKEKESLDKQSRLEELVTNYTISQNIKFKKEDIEALDKILDAELDSSFVTDLRTDSERTKQMEKEILAFNDKLKKPSEIITMKVKNFLPDLSEALKKLGNKKIESNYKPDAVYYSEGYDVSILSIEETLPDLSIEIDKEDAFETKPQHNEIEYLDPNYSFDVPKLSITETLKVNNSIKPDTINEEFVKDNFNTENKDNPAQKLIKQINESKTDVKPKEIKKVVPDTKKEEITNVSKPQYIIDNESLIVLNTAKINQNIGFHLAKSNSGYTVLGYINNELIKLKTYDNLKSEQIQARLNKRIDEQTSSYIIKIGTAKFIVEVIDNNIKYLMDL